MFYDISLVFCLFIAVIICKTFVQPDSHVRLILGARSSTVFVTRVNLRFSVPYVECLYGAQFFSVAALVDDTPIDSR